MTRCEIVAVNNLSDVLGDHCENVAAGQCSDCGTPICEVHTETCEMCARSVLFFLPIIPPSASVTLQPAAAEHRRQEHKSA
jgi:hypothetical protein